MNMNIGFHSFLRSSLAFAVLLLGWNSSYAQCSTSTVPTYNTQCGSSSSVYINSVSTTGGVTNITNNGTGCGNTSTSYSDYTSAHTVTANAGSSINITTATTNTSNITRVAVYIDFNQNGIYETGLPEENVYTQLYYLAANNHTMTIAVPALAKDGTTTMRVRAIANGTTSVPTVGPCNTENFGETEDYTFNVINPCLPPDILEVSNVDYRSAEISWSEKDNSRLYEYVVSADPSFYPNSHGYTYTTQRFVPLSDLICDTTYYVYVRCVCDTSGSSITWDTSSWKIDSFTTDPCCYDPNPSMSNITSTSAVGRWDPVGSAYGYEYAVTIQNKPPQNGTYTTYTSAFLQGLMSSQLYYLHVRTRCSPTPLSGWKSVPFATGKTLNVNNVNGSNIFEIAAYPNPVNNVLNLQINGEVGSKAVVHLTDVTGKVLLSDRVNANTKELNVSDLPSGIYLLKYSDGYHTETIKVTKQ